MVASIASLRVFDDHFDAADARSRIEPDGLTGWRRLATLALLAGTSVLMITPAAVAALSLLDGRPL